jgi:hypothetical protein
MTGAREHHLLPHIPLFVMAGLVPATHDFRDISN